MADVTDRVDAAFVERVRAAMRDAAGRGGRNSSTAGSPTSRERERLVRKLHAQGLGDGDISRRLGLRHGSVQRIRVRLGLPALFAQGGKRVSP